MHCSFTVLGDMMCCSVILRQSDDMSTKHTQDDNRLDCECRFNFHWELKVKNLKLKNSSQILYCTVRCVGLHDVLSVTPRQSYDMPYQHTQDDNRLDSSVWQYQKYKWNRTRFFSFFDNNFFRCRIQCNKFKYTLYFHTQAQALLSIKYKVPNMVFPTLPPPEMYSSFLPEGRPCHNI